MALQLYHLGCPMWAKKEWVGELFSANAKPAEFLRQYASVFNAVEGNTTFYAMPSPKSVNRWLEDTPSGFRFCFKFPQERKPKVPVRFIATGSRPIVRFVGHPLFEKMLDHLSEWATQFVNWIAEGKTPYMFIHAPDDFYSPRIARVFHNLLLEKNESVGVMLEWPSRGEGEGQLRLL